MRLVRPATAMDSLRKWLYKPKRDDRSLLAQFFFADEALNMVAAELDSFDGREDPERCSTLVNQLRHAQERVLNITGQIMDQLLGNERTPRGFRVKFPEDVLQDNLAGQLWFGAECLAAGSSIMHREEESTAMRPLARALTRSLETVRALLREHCLRCNRYGAPPPPACTEMLHESLKIFDRLFAEFEFYYVSAMVPVKSPREFEVQQLISVLFSETLQRARRIGLLTQDQVDDYDPALMFAIPRLAIVSGLLIYSNGPLSIDKPPELMSDMFRPFRNLLHKIRELLWTLDRRELYLLEKLLCTNEDIANIRFNVDVSNENGACYPAISDFVTQFYSDFSHCKDMLNQMGCEWESSYQDNPTSSSSQDKKKISERNTLITEADYIPETMEIFSPILDGMRRLSNITLIDDMEETLLQDSERNNSLFASIIAREAEASAGIGGQDSSVADEFNEDKNTFRSQKNDRIKLNVEYCETENNDTINTKDSDNEDPQEKINLAIVKNERRNSNRSIGSRKSSRNENISNELIIRNLSSNGLSMFDPLSGSDVMNMISSNDVLMPDQNLVSNLSEQVSEIADKLSSISYRENSENVQDSKMPHIDSNITNLLHDQVSGQIYSFSTNDVSNLGASINDPEFNNINNNVTYSPSRNEKMLSQQSNMPSTSHGYLISNAISQEPAIMASMSNNNSMYDDSMLSSMNVPLMGIASSTTFRNIENDMFGEPVSTSNPDPFISKNEYQNSSIKSSTPQNSALVLKENIREPEFKKQPNTNKAQFFLGYESDSNDQTPGDSGICTENTSLDRSPDSEVKDLSTRGEPNNISVEIKCFDGGNQNISTINIGGDNDGATDYLPSDVVGSLHLKYTEDTENFQNNEAGPSHRVIPQDFSKTCANDSAKKSDISISDNSTVSDNSNKKEALCGSCDSHMCSCDPNKCNINTNIIENADLATSEISNLQVSYDNINIKVDCDNKLSVDNVSNVNVTDSSSKPSLESNNNPDSRHVELSPTTNEPSPCTNDASNSSSLRPHEQSTSTSSSTAVLNQRKLKKSSPKNKKKSSKSRHSTGETRTWSPGRVILQNRSHMEQRSPIKLNLDQLVDDCPGGSCSSQSSATSSFHSDWADDEEIALALQAQEFASRHQTRAKFRSSEDLIHRLFVCIAGVADQLQTNFASDLRNILKSVFQMNQTPEIEPEKTEDVEETKVSQDDTAQQDERAESSTANNEKRDAIEYEVSESEVLMNGDSFDSIHSAEEVYADNNSPVSQRSNQNVRLSEPNMDVNEQNDLNERRNSQPSKRNTDESNSDSRSSSRRNTISSIVSRPKCTAENRNSSSDDQQTDDANSISNNMDEINDRLTSNDQISDDVTTTNNSDELHSDNVHSRNVDNLSDATDRQRYEVNGQNYINDNSHYRSNQEIRENVINDNVCIRDRRLRTQSISAGFERAPEWVPDIAAPDCMRCGVHFTAFRRRHHCRNCGKVFCASCSANSIPLPRFGQLKPVRVCEECFQLLAKKACASRQITNANGARQASYTHR